LLPSCCLLWIRAVALPLKSMTKSLYGALILLN
jgi:hypothetical protein